MKTKGLLRIVVLFFCVIGFSGCNDDESEFSSNLRFNKHFFLI